MKISRKICFHPVTEGAAVFSTRTTYSSASAPHLLQQFSELGCSDTFGNSFLRRSTDNGRTWSKAELTWKPEPIENGTMRRGEFTFLFDAARERILRFFNYSFYPADGHYSMETKRSHRIFFDVSHDEGKTFSEARQLIAVGHDAVKWAPDVCYKKNNSAISFCRPFFDSAGRIILPAQRSPVLPPDSKTYAPYPIESLCFTGETAADGEILWTAGKRAIADPLTQSTRGLCEPAIRALSRGRMLMICRGSNASATHLPGRKWFTISSDGGQSWSRVKPLGYDTGELFFSSATGSHLRRSSFSGKLYWVGNIVPENPDGNQPRYPLCIAEVDEDRVALRKDSVVTIDTLGPEDTPRLQLSNFSLYEDRESGEFVLHLARLFERSETSFECPAYEYRIDVKNA